MRKLSNYFVVLFILAICFSCNSNKQTTKGLKDFYMLNYQIGAAIYPEVFDDLKTATLLKTHFNSITPENLSL